MERTTQKLAMGNGSLGNLFDRLKTVAITALVVASFSQTSAHATPEKSALPVRQPLNWGLGNFKSTRGINVEGAWKKSRGSRNIVVAIIDTGADYTHPDLIPNLWRNPGESGLDSLKRPKASNGIDDDGNGYIDDEIGWDFVGNDSKPFDTHGHGTHIAGIIGGTGVHKIQGVSPEVSLMILKYYNPQASGEQNLINTIRAINYAVDNGAQIINYSAGGPSYSAPEHTAIERALARGVLFVSAAGNEHQNADLSQYFPASYTLENILSVTAIDNLGQILPSSNFGPKSVDIAAPGKNIISSAPSDGAAAMTGTSQATAFVTGIAALMMAKLPPSPSNFRIVKDLIMKSGQKLPSLESRTVTGSLVDADRALTLTEESLTKAKPVPTQVVQAKKSGKKGPVRTTATPTSPRF